MRKTSEMSQLDILEILRKNPDRWFTIKEISETLKLNRTNVGKQLLRLLVRRKIIERYYNNNMKMVKLNDNGGKDENKRL